MEDDRVADRQSQSSSRYGTISYHQLTLKYIQEDAAAPTLVVKQVY
jgi:hypothetical protein